LLPERSSSELAFRLGWVSETWVADYRADQVVSGTILGQQPCPFLTNIDNIRYHT
jgi:hypothetical protein